MSISATHSTGFIPASPGDPDSWLTLGPGNLFTDDGQKYPFIAQLVQEHGANRNPKRVRPFRDGWKLDNTGRDGDEWTLDLTFNPDVSEGDVSVSWPGDLQTFIDVLGTGKTHTLNLPWKRGIRAKADSWDRLESATDNRGGATLRVKFSEDNEDNLDRQSVQLVSVKATVQNQVQAAQFDAESSGMDMFAIADITSLAEDVVGLLNTPGDVAASLLTAGNALRRACKLVATTFSSTDPGRDQMSDPSGSNARLKLLALAELGARAVGEARPKPTRTMTFTRDRDIWTIATELNQNARDLMTINEQIEDFAFIQAGTPVRVFA